MPTILVARDHVTRRDAASPLQRRPVRDQATEDPLTAARCLELLAQLESQLTALRRLARDAKTYTSTTGSPGSTNPNRSNNGTAVPKRKRNRVHQTYSSSHIRKRTKSNHPTTVTPPPKSRVYGELRRSQQSPSANQLAVITPICARNRKVARQREVSINQNRYSEPLRENETQCPLDESLQSFRARVGEVRYRIYSTVFEWLRDLFLETAVTQNGPHLKSLLSMCLRRVPECVEHTDGWRKKGFNADTKDACSHASTVLDLYLQLETLGFGSRNWALMARAVRAHGVLTLARGIVNGLFDPSFVSLLVDLCLSMGCVREAVRISSAAAWRLPRPRKATSCLAESSKSLPTHALLTILSERSGRRCGLIFDHVSDLLKEKRLPPSWIHTGPFTEVLTYAVKAVRDGPCAAAAAEMLALGAVLAIHDNSFRSPAERSGCCHQTLVRIAAGLGTAAIMARRRSASSPVQCGAFKRLCHTLRLCALSLSQQPLKQRGPGTFLFAVTEHVVSIELEHCAFDAQQTASDILATAAKSRDEYIYLALRLMRAMGRVLARGRDISHAQEDISQFCRRFQWPRLPEWFRQGLDEAEKDVDFVLHASSNALRVGGPSVGAWTPPAGWVWEEGLGEWSRTDS